MDINEIQELIRFVAKSGVNEVEIQNDNFKLTIKTDSIAKRGKGKQLVEQQQLVQQVPMMQQVPAMAQPVIPQPVQQVTPATEAQTAKSNKEKLDAADSDKYVTIKSPMIGTFYRSPGPDKPQFINVGDDIQPGKVLCIIEAMKLFNEIESEHSGKIVKVLVDDSSPVEYDQPLFLIQPH